MGSSFYRLDIVLHLPRVSVIFLLPKKVKKRKNESRVKWLLCFFFFFFETTNNQQLKEGIKKKKKRLRSIMISLDSAVSLISDDASGLSRTVWSCSWVGGGGGDNFGERAPVWSPWSSMTQPGPPRPEHLDEEYKSGDVSSQSALITRRPRSPSKLHISHACSLLVITQREDMGEFFFFFEKYEICVKKKKLGYWFYSELI